MSHQIREWIRLIEAGQYYRGTRSDPVHSKRPTLSFTTDPDVASIYASIPKKGEYGPGAQVSRADFAMQNPVDLGDQLQMDLNSALDAVGISDASEHVDDVIKLIMGLANMADHDVPFSAKIAYNLDWIELARAVRRAANNENWEQFFNLLDYTEADTYALCDTKTFVRLAKQSGHDGIIHMDIFDGGAKVAQQLIGKTKDITHLTYRPFGRVTWGA